jgi:hypothetical protein
MTDPHTLAQHLIEAGRKATGGRWRSNYEHIWAVGYKVAECPWDLSGSRPSKQCFADAYYIALASPSNITLLAEGYLEMERELESYRASRAPTRDRSLAGPNSQPSGKED